MTWKQHLPILLVVFAPLSLTGGGMQSRRRHHKSRAPSGVDYACVRRWTQRAAERL